MAKLKVSTRVKYVIVFQVDGLDLEGVKKTLSVFGHVTDVQDDILNGTIPVKLVYMDSNMIQFSLIKSILHLAPMSNNEYILFPMISEKEKRRVMEAFNN